MKYLSLILILIPCMLSAQNPDSVTENSIYKVDSVDHSQLAKKFYDDFQFEKAIAEYKKQFEQDSTDLKTLNMMAICNVKLGRLFEARDNYKLLLKTDSLNVSALNQLGLVYASEYNYPRALIQFIKLVSIDPSNSYYHKMLAQYYSKINFADSAINHYTIGLRLNENDITMLYDLGDIYLAKQEYDIADSLSSLGLTKDSTNARLLTLKVRASYFGRNYAQALMVAKKLAEIQNGASPSLLQIIGVSYYQLEDYRMCIESLEEAMQYMPEPSEKIAYYLGLAYRELEDYQTSEFYLKLAIDAGISRNLPMYYTNLGVTYERDGNFEESIRAFQAAYQDSKDKILLYQLARTYDIYYKDKTVALNYYKLYLSSKDTANIPLMRYSSRRIRTLKEIIHSTDTLNDE